MRYRYRNRLERDHLGRRVVIRRWVEDDERGMVPSDVLGVLEAWTEHGVLRIRTKHGEVVDVDEGSIIAAKPLPQTDSSPP